MLQEVQPFYLPLNLMYAESLKKEYISRGLEEKSYEARTAFLPCSTPQSDELIFCSYLYLGAFSPEKKFSLKMKISII